VNLDEIERGKKEKSPARMKEGAFRGDKKSSGPAIIRLLYDVRLEEREDLKGQKENSEASRKERRNLLKDAELTHLGDLEKMREQRRRERG